MRKIKPIKQNKTLQNYNVFIIKCIHVTEKYALSKLYFKSKLKMTNYLEDLLILKIHNWAIHLLVTYT